MESLVENQRDFWFTLLRKDDTGDQLLILINPANATWLLACSLFKGIGTAALSGTLFAMVADTIEYGQWKTGKRVEGMLYSSTTFGAKIGAGVGGAIALGVIGAAGYNGLAVVQTESAVEAIKAMYLIMPIPFLILIPVFLSSINWIRFIRQ